MNVFVLGTGRCGTMTFVRACEHLSNYSAGHETRTGLLGADRFAYPPDHIEADNRLTWFLPSLRRAQPDAYYVHLRRDTEAVVESFVRRFGSPYRSSMIRAFAHGVLVRSDDWEDARAVCRFYVDTVTDQIDSFLAGRPSMTLWLEQAAVQFPAFLERIEAEGDIGSALREWDIAHNAS